MESLSRRDSLRRTALLAGYLLTPALRQQLRSQDSANDLGATAEMFQAFVEDSLMDQDGLVRSFFNVETRKPFTNEELQVPAWKKLVTDWAQNSPDPAAAVAYENALMGTGEYALSQMARFASTKTDEAKQNAARAIRAIVAVAEEGRYYMPGYLPKPFGGLARARYSHEISVDQYTKSIAALYHWRPLATAEEKAAIDQFILDAAEFFIARKFRHSYRHRTIVTADSHLHALGLFIMLPWLAAEVSGDKGYLDHLGQFDSALEAAKTDEGLAGFNQTSLVIEGFHTALLAGATDERLTELIGIRWNLALENVDEEGNTFLRGEPTSQGARIAAIATLVKEHHPDIDSLPVARKILGQLPEIGSMTNPRVPGAISTTSISSWLLGYWRMKQSGA